PAAPHGEGKGGGADEGAQGRFKEEWEAAERDGAASSYEQGWIGDGIQDSALANVGDGADGEREGEVGHGDLRLHRRCGEFAEETVHMYSPKQQLGGAPGASG